MEGAASVCALARYRSDQPQTCLLKPDLALGAMGYHAGFSTQRLIAMTAVTDTLLNALENCDMLEIDGLHAFDFYLDEDDNLHIECMDGRANKRWQFSLAQVEAAVFDSTLHSWTLCSDAGEHRLVCLSAVSGSNQEDDEHADA